MKRILTMGIFVMLLPVFAMAVAGCGDDDTDGHGNMSGMNQAPHGSIRVDLVNWAVEPAQTSAKAGKIAFWAVHDMGHSHGASEGGNTHDLQVMKKQADGSFELAGQVQGLKMGEAKALTLTLQPGDYELSCNVVEELKGEFIPHYAKGMHIAFTVTS